VNVKTAKNRIGFQAGVPAPVPPFSVVLEDPDQWHAQPATAATLGEARGIAKNARACGCTCVAIYDANNTKVKS
jgi:hypothetical protein